VYTSPRINNQDRTWFTCVYVNTLIKFSFFVLILKLNCNENQDSNNDDDY